MSDKVAISIEHGAVVEVPLNKLKASPRNARKTHHAAADVEALAASIAAKGMIQPPVVEPERNAEGEPTGYYLVTVGEGRRQAMLLRAKRKEIGKAHAVRCVVDLANDAHEISLDENVTRFAMHPADQFEAFQRLADERGYGAEDIAARFGVTPLVVRQRLKLAGVSPKLMTLYREGGMSLDQVMAFTLTDDHDRQEAVWASLSWNKEPSLIRRLLNEDRVSARDRRALLVGAEAYADAGGVIERDLFAEDHGGYFADPALLDRMAMERLQTVAEAELKAGWKWATPTLDSSSAHGLRRVYPRARELTKDEEAHVSELAGEYDAAVANLGDDEDPEVVARIDALDAELAAFHQVAYDPEELGRAGVFVVLGTDGQVRIERGFVKPEDEQPVTEASDDEPQPEADARPAALSERLVADLTAHRTAALRSALGDSADIALTAVVHALALQCFDFDHGFGSCLDLRLDSLRLDSFAADVAEGPAVRSLEARRARWAALLPRTSPALWVFLLSQPLEVRLDLLAHCVAESVNAVQTGAGRSRALDHADQLAEALGLDMADYWTPTVAAYLGRVTKGRILEAVQEGVSADAAERIEGLKKAALAQEAETLLKDRRWLPVQLRKPSPDEVERNAA